MKSRVAAIQMVSGAEVAANLETAGSLIAEAAAQGAGLVVLPENFAIMGRSDRDKLMVREAEGVGPIQDFLERQARRHALWLIGGTIPLAGPDQDRVYASCLAYGPDGRRGARYDKLHLFDVELSASGERYAESATIAAGREVAIVETPLGRVGLAVCYDLRFPEMFRAMGRHGVDLIALPSAFTAETGRAHWEVLLRARAVENLCYVIAADQGGRHADGRETYGDSMIVEPWGQVLSRLASGTGVVVADVDRTRLDRLRREFPSLEHRRLVCELPETP
jgi:nitrilase